MKFSPRDRALAALRETVEQGKPLLATGAGTGLAAGAAEAGGADLIVIYNSGRFRAAGLSSLSGLLPFGNANTTVLELAREVLPAVSRTPILAGVCAVDPYVDLDALVHQLREMGISGVQNFPTITLYGAAFVADLEATGISFEREVELMRAARRAGLLTSAFVTNASEAEQMAMAGVDILSPHLGVTRATDRQLALVDAARDIDAITESARLSRDDLLVLFHGGPAVTPADVREIREEATNVHGFFAASSVERMPIAAAVTEAVTAFKQSTSPATGGDRSTAPDFTTAAPSLPYELTIDSLPAYLRERALVTSEDPIHVAELGGGLSNVVLRWQCGELHGIVKQSRPQLRVEEEWLADVRRILNERAAIEILGPLLPPGSIPRLAFKDDEMFAFGMESAPPGALLWKPLLLEGRLDLRRARQAGALLRGIHDATRDDPAVATRFAAQPLLEQNRLNPWYRFAARAHPDLAAVFEYAIARLLAVKQVLVHGDFVPKNMLLLDDGILLLDYEVAHFGNPGYDVATFINHMMLKGFRAPEDRDGFATMAMAFWVEYQDGLELRDRELVEGEVQLQLGALMLARVDGKSTVEYLPQEGARSARRFGRLLLRNQCASVRAIVDKYEAFQSD